MIRLFCFWFLLTSPVLAQTSAPTMLAMNTPSTNGPADGPLVFRAETRLRQFDLLRQQLTDTVRMARRGNVCQVIQMVSDGQDAWCVVRFWPFTNQANDPAWLSVADNSRYYAIRWSELQTRAQPYAKNSSATLGSVAVPLKFRFGNGRERAFDFSKDVAIGTSFGYRQGLSVFQPRYINYLLNIGVSSVTADPFTTSNAVRTNTDVAAFTPAIGLLLELNDVQIGLFSGMDYVAKELGRNWIHQGRPWLSFGIGYRLLTWNSSSSSRGTNK